MKKHFLVCIIFFLSAFCFCEVRKQLKTVGPTDVIMVGKITVHVDENFDFYSKLYDIKNYSNPDCYVIYDDSYKIKIKVDLLGRVKLKSNNACSIVLPDDYFLSKRHISKDTLVADTPVEWHFYCDDDFVIDIPLEFEAKIPHGEKYIYVGDFDYYLEGSDFHVEKMTVSDNYDQAKEAVERIYEKPIDLCRVEIRKKAEE